MTPEYLRQRSPDLLRGTSSLVLAAVFVMGLVALLYGSGRTELSAAAFVCILAIPLLLVLLLQIGGGSLTQSMLSPTGLMIGFVWANVLFVPILWAAGLANPWFDFPLGDTTFVLGSAALSSGVLTLGVILGMRRPRPPVSLAATGDGLRMACWIGLICVALASLWVSRQTGGISYLLDNLLSKRELLAGLGPATALAATAGVAGLTVPSVFTTDTSTRVAGYMCAVSYLGYLFVMGSRFPMVAYALALLVARSARAQVSRRALALVMMAVLPFSVWYSVSVRRGQLLESGGTGTRSASTLIDPFVCTGPRHSPHSGCGGPRGSTGLALQSGPVDWPTHDRHPAGGLPSKPPGMSTTFSKVFFPVSWANGSGVPTVAGCGTCVDLGRG